MTLSRGFSQARDPEARSPAAADEFAPGDADRLLIRFRAGDAEAVGEFLHRYGPLVRAHYRRKIGLSMQRLVDSQDLLSTITRRLCQRVMSHRVQAENTKQLWALVYRIGNDALVDRVKIISRLRDLEHADSPFVQALRSRLDTSGSAAESEFAERLSAMLEHLSTDLDREMLVRWLHGEPLASIAHSLTLSPAAVRQRWKRLRDSLRVAWETENSSDGTAR